MVSFRVFFVLSCMVSNTFAFTTVADYHSTSPHGLKSRTITERKIEACPAVSRSTIHQCDWCFSRNVALSMTTDEMTNSTMELTSKVESAFPNAEILTFTLGDHVPLGCTVDESLHPDDNYVFISKLTKDGNAEGAGLKVGDVLVGVTGLFGDLVCTIETDAEKIKRLVSAVAEEDPLTIQVARGTDVLERHESIVVDVCNGSGASEKEVQECVVDFIAGGYDYDDNEPAVDCEEDDGAECLIDDMMNLWADELPPPSTTSGITADTVQKTSKPKPWSSRSSPSGTWVRDPKTGKMRNIDA